MVETTDSILIYTAKATTPDEVVFRYKGTASHGVIDLNSERTGILNSGDNDGVKLNINKMQECVNPAFF